MTQGFTADLENGTHSHGHANSQVRYTDLHGPHKHNRIMLLTILSTVSEIECTIMLNLQGQFITLSLAATVEPWVFLLHYLGYQIEHVPQFLYSITCVYNIYPMENVADR